MAQSPFGAAITELRRPIMPYVRQQIGFYREGGVTVLAGSDVGNQFLAPGVSLHRELELLVEAGMTIREALASATKSPAEVFEIKGLGCLRAGCIADLVLLERDPLDDISNIRSIAGVALAGRYHERSKLEDSASAALSDYDEQSN